MNDESKNNQEAIYEPAPMSTENPILNPELIRRVASMLASGGTASEQTKETGTSIANHDNKTDAISSDALSALLSDPSILQRLPQIISVMRPLLNTSSSPSENSSTPTVQPSKTDNNRDQLLLSLKPFLSPSRCEAIDTMLRIARLGELFGQFK